MVSVQSVLRQVPDPRGKQDLKHPLHALPGLMLLSMHSGRKGMMAMAQAFGPLTAETGAQADTDTNHLSLDGKTLRGSKDCRRQGRTCTLGLLRRLGPECGPCIVARQGDGDPRCLAAH